MPSDGPTATERCIDAEMIRESWSSHIFYREDMTRTIERFYVYFKHPCYTTDDAASVMAQKVGHDLSHKLHIVPRPKDPICILGYSVGYSPHSSTDTTGDFFVGTEELKTAIIQGEFGGMWETDRPTICYFEGKWKDFWPDTIWID